MTEPKGDSLAALARQLEALSEEVKAVVRDVDALKARG